MKSADFLDVDKYPTITFESTSAHTGSSNLAVVSGTLTFHGVTKPVFLEIKEQSDEIKDPWGNQRVGVTAVSSIRMSDFGITYNGLLENGAAIVADDVEITLDAQIIRESE